MVPESSTTTSDALSKDQPLSMKAPDNRWNHVVGLEIFGRITWEHITTLDLPGVPYDDKWVWTNSIRGNVTTPAAYSFLLNSKLPSNLPSFNWNDMWRIDIPTKIKKFLWKIIHETLAIKEAAFVAIQKNYMNVIFESDSKMLIESLAKCACPIWKLQALVLDTFDILSVCNFINFKFVFRECNQAAPWAANFARSSRAFQIWSSIRPHELEQIIIIAPTSTDENLRDSPFFSPLIEGCSSTTSRFHRDEPAENQCSSTVFKHIKAPINLVWSRVRTLDEPQKYKPFVETRPSVLRLMDDAKGAERLQGRDCFLAGLR
ncbi:abscisic acid receptor PYL8 [Canna indica]|uniref:Abscisic acid receptor PYL8 n=1 Tax=Canna indica TaxID=4628 RepID=A0AAQ3KBV7_9LILI|nr:abscisic acid receptor PYL8 [Canna indica]